MSADPHSLTDWLAGPLGRALLVREQRVVREALDPVFGSYLLQIGSWGPRDTFLSLARTQRCALVAEPDAQGDFVSHATALAVAASSVDALFLPHTLEFEPDAHEVLRESARVLVGDGHLLVLGFEPFGPWGLRHRLARAGFPPGLANLWSAGRLADWLRLLGFDVAPRRRYLGLWPAERLVGTSLGNGLERGGEWVANAVSSRLPRPLSALPFAGAYVLSARKRVYTMTRLIAMRRRRAPRLNAQLVPPAARSGGPYCLDAPAPRAANARKPR